MDILKYIFLGILQGITEPLPISSSGHIYVCKALLNTSLFNDLNLEIFLNFASFVAILIILRKDIMDIIKGSINYFKSKREKDKKKFKYLLLMVVSTIPVSIVGLLFNKNLSSLLSKNVFIVGFGFIVTALALILVMNEDGDKEDIDITFTDAIMIGLCQAVSIVPGISRCGVVLVSCLLCGLNKNSALKYTFMLYLPVSIGTMVLGVGNVITSGVDMSLLYYYLLGMGFAFITTYFSYRFLTNSLINGKLWTFSVYLFAVALFTIIYFI